MIYINSEFLEMNYTTTEKLNVRIDSHNKYGWPKQGFHHWILEHIDLEGLSNTLDIGCGTGIFLQEIAKRKDNTFRLVGIDRSLAMVTSTKKALESFSSNYKIEQVDFDHLEKMDIGNFDMISANHVIHYASDIQRVIHAIKNKLSTKGFMICATNGSENNILLNHHNECLEQVGLCAEQDPINKFSLENGHLFLRNEFRYIQCFVQYPTLEFKEVNPVVEYYESSMVEYGLNRFDLHYYQLREELIQLMTKRIKSVIDEDGSYKIYKKSGFFYASDLPYIS